jgi:S1-C subfamily serine protease
VFVVPATRAAVPGPRLGVSLGMADGQPRIDKVGADSLAERSGLRAGDRVLRVAGTSARSTQDLTTAVREQPPGTVLPIVVQRDGREVEVLVRFPPRTP